jgi:hypothetical protein
MDGTIQLAERMRRSARARKGIARVVLATSIGTLLCIMPNAGSAALDAKKPFITYKQYAALVLDNHKEYKCLATLYGKESAWNPNAVNGSHYGIPQGNSMYLKSVNGYRQVEWGIKYNNKRYGSMCKALQHYKIKGWH